MSLKVQWEYHYEDWIRSQSFQWFQFGWGFVKICESPKLTKMYVLTFHSHSGSLSSIRHYLFCSWHTFPFDTWLAAKNRHTQVWNVFYSTSRMRTFHTSSPSTRRAAESVVFGWAVALMSGHLHLGRARIAKVGVMKVNVPPWRIGNLRSHKERLFCSEAIF